jgi:hypothetical protein
MEISPMEAHQDEGKRLTEKSTKGTLAEADPGMIE